MGFLVLPVLFARERPRREFRMRVTLAEIATVPAVVGVIALIASSPSGVSWLALSGVLAILAGIVDAWILLIEILR